jgi:hypothetical protein
MYNTKAELSIRVDAIFPIYILQKNISNEIFIFDSLLLEKLSGHFTKWFYCLFHLRSSSGRHVGIILDWTMTYRDSVASDDVYSTLNENRRTKTSDVYLYTNASNLILWLATSIK